jgi:predicted RNA-binding protein with PIN domain
MHYLIDGYNLLHATGHLVGKVSPARLEQARLTLLDHIVASLGAEARFVTVVFDARRAPRGTPAEENHHGVRILNALETEADDLIEVLIRTHPTPHKLTVVSQDRRLLEAAARRRCLTQACVDFYEAIALPRRPEPAPVAEKPQVLSKEVAAELLRAFGGTAE